MTRTPNLTPLGDGLNVLVFGASGGVGAAMTQHLARAPGVAHVTAASRTPVSAPSDKVSALAFDLADEASIAGAVERACARGPLHLVVAATGVLHRGDALAPEKSLKALTPNAFAEVLAVNTIGPSVIAKHALPALDKSRTAVLAALSARVGSISDNRLGGWHAYRASKAALNQIIRTCAIELRRTHPKAACIALHPGTVDTDLSRPYQRGVPAAKLFTPAFSAGALLEVCAQTTPAHSGRIFDYAGQEIAP